MAARRPPKALPATIYWFALPRRFHDESVRRYGFHGLSYEHIASVLPEAAPEIAEGRVVVAHLGSGERSPEIRERACERAAWLGIELDHAANRAGGPRISTDGSRVAAYVVPTDEEQMIARHTLATPCRAPTDGAA